VTSQTPVTPHTPGAPGVMPAASSGPMPSPPGPTPSAAANPPGGAATAANSPPPVDLARRRDELVSRVTELQWDLGGLVYEMAIRNHIRVDVLVRRAATLQEVDSELGEVERILRLHETGTAGACANCGAPHSSGAAYCWQCGQPLLEHVPTHAIGAGAAPPAPSGGAAAK
jgi:hypothetical protein